MIANTSRHNIKQNNIVSETLRLTANVGLYFALSATHKEHLRGVFSFLFLKAYSFWFDK